MEVEMTETPDYTVIRIENEFEIRAYPGYIKAEVELSDTNYQAAIYKGFSKLAGYIFGNNHQSQKMAMTSPVQVSDSTKIKMTKPVTVRGDGVYTVAFIMPSGYTLTTLPEPDNDDIRFSQVEPHTMAVKLFSGYFRESKVKKVEQALMAWIESEGYTSKGDFIVARYDPPWVPWFLARNEVMIEIDPVEQREGQSV